MDKVKAAVIGATGYAGAELCGILLSHPSAEICALSSVSFEGKELCDIYPGFKGAALPTLTDADCAIQDADVVFASLPHGLSEEIAEKCLSRGRLFIDFGADFRLESEDDYREWYKKPFDKPELHSEAVYALPELFRDRIRGKKILANPGCYPTAAALALYPALKYGLIEKSGIVIDAKSGVTGAGRGLTQTSHFPDANESVSAYKIGTHRHTPEIEQTLSYAAGERINVLFVPHLLPINRGIEETIYTRLKSSAPADEIRSVYEEFYKNEVFVRIEKSGESAQIKNVTHTNFCDISVHMDARTGSLILCSCIDNMVKGAAGQAVQNMNLALGFDESRGLITYTAGF